MQGAIKTKKRKEKKPHCLSGFSKLAAGGGGTVPKTILINNSKTPTELRNPAGLPGQQLPLQGKKKKTDRGHHH